MHLERASGEQLLLELFDSEYQVMHLAAHGEASDDPKHPGGLVLGPAARLSSAQISKLRHVPELVFLNCCHLGNMQADAQPRWGALAASLATTFIEMGCKAVVAAGWAVNDHAARQFALTFHRAMLQGKCFGDALQMARDATYQAYRTHNTWGAYQAYGDEQYKYEQTAQSARVSHDVAQLRSYSHVGQALSDLEQLHASLQDALDDAQRAQRNAELTAIETACRAHYFAHGELRARLAAIHADLGDRDSAIAHYRAALAQEDASLSMKALEQLGNLEVRQAVTLHEQKQHEAGQQMLESGETRLRAVLALQATSERHNLLASMYKRIGQARLRVPPEQLGHADWLKKMCQHYKTADGIAQKQGGVRYYPLLNWLDGQALQHAMGQDVMDQDKPLTQTALAAYLALAQENAIQHNRMEPGFFHAVAEIDAERTAALWACLSLNPGPAPLTDAAVQASLQQRYAALRQRLGAAREWDSVSNQLDWLYAVWPADPPKNFAIRGALRSLAMQLRALK